MAVIFNNFKKVQDGVQAIYIHIRIIMQETIVFFNLHFCIMIIYSILFNLPERVVQLLRFYWSPSPPFAWSASIYVCTGSCLHININSSRAFMRVYICACVFMANIRIHLHVIITILYSCELTYIHAYKSNKIYMQCSAREIDK